MDDSGNDIVLAGKNNSSVTIRTDIADVQIGISSLGVDWGGQYQLEGKEVVEAALDIAGIFDPIGVCDVTNAGIQFSEGRYLDSAVSLFSVIPIIGDMAKAPRIGRSINHISKAISSGQRQWTKSLKKNMVQLYGEAPAGTHAHHVFPVKYKDFFDRFGMDINNPGHGVFLEEHHHLSHAKEYNKQWEDFILEAKEKGYEPSVETVYEKGKELMERVYEVEW